VQLASQRFPSRWSTATPIRDLVEAVTKEGRDAVAIAAEAGTEMGARLPLLMDALNPQVIVLGSLAVALGEKVFAPMRRIVAGSVSRRFILSRGKMKSIFLCILVGVLSAAFHNSVLAQSREDLTAWPRAKYNVRIERSVMIPARDGVKLSTDIYFPEGIGERLPVILIRTPYNKKLLRSELSSPAYQFASQGFVVAVQDTRGRFESEGNFTISFPDSEDGYDTTGWLAAQPWSTGKVGTYGCSYLGDVQIMQARLNHPNLTAMIPQAAGSSYPHRGFGASFGGAYELAGNVGWFTANGSKVFLRPPAGAAADFWARMGDAFNPGPVEPKFNHAELWRTLPIIDLLKKLGAIPTDWEDTISHGPDDSYWLNLGYLQSTDRFDTPALQINSWYDFGVGLTLDQFNLMRWKAMTERGRDNQFFVISPTAHCRSETATEHTIVGQRDLGDARFGYYKLYLQWFDYWLKGIDNGCNEDASSDDLRDGEE